MSAPEPKVCEVGGGGLILPLGGDSEHEWPKELRAVLYLAGLLWCLYGVAIVADVFMASIEKITSRKALIFDKNIEQFRTCLVWNPTVANLTLKAIGFAAPQILLNVIGIFSAEFYAGELGPFTIVGSAAFNLFCVIAVCIVAIPNGEIRKIKDVGVFAVTGAFSIFAYIWLLFILMGTSPDVVDAWEGILTFVFFWVLVLMAFLADTRGLPCCKNEEAVGVVQKATAVSEIAELERKVRQKYGKICELSEEDIAHLIEYERSQASGLEGLSGAVHRGKEVIKDTANQTVSRGAQLAAQITSVAAKIGAKDIVGELNDQGETTIEFAGSYTVLESLGSVSIDVVCKGRPLEHNVQIEYSSENGSAKDGKDFEAVSGLLEFGPGQTKQSFKVKIFRDTGYEEKQHFFLKLEGTGVGWSFGKLKKTKVTIIDQDLPDLPVLPGVFRFERERIEIPREYQDYTQEILIRLMDRKPVEARCRLVTEDDTAVAGLDFEAIDQEIVFAPQQDVAHAYLRIKADTKYEGTEQFRVIIREATGGAIFDKTTDGGAESCIMTVILLASPGKNTLIKMNRDIIELGQANYKEQFTSAFWVGGSRQDAKESTWGDVAMHILSVPWKLLFAAVPPTDFCGGWLCFSVALLMIGFVTCLIGDLAELLSCVLNIGPGVTAITLVAVGTSLPNMLASKTSAPGDPYADASIGHVIGSNAVNIFLGLGFPWMIASIYWQLVAGVKLGDKWSLMYPEQSLKYPEGIFVVPAGALGTSVSIFSACAVMCVVCLLVRRQVFGGELGGPKVPAYLSACLFVSLWILYIVLSIVLSD